MKRIKFQDNKAFYAALKKAISEGNGVEVTTDFNSLEQIPTGLRDIFELDSHANPLWVDVATGMFVVGATAPVGFNAKPLYVLAGAGAGAGIGFMVGGPVGAAVGGALGMGAGVLAAMSIDAGEVEVVITKEGKIIIRMKKAA
jgi:hypothetical protein